MRSILLHLKNTSRDDISAFLTVSYPLQEGPPWLYTVDDIAYLYIDIYEDMAMEFEPEQANILAQKLGGAPSVSIIADVTGRHSSYDCAREFTITVLTRFEGLAQDDYSDYFWTVDEVLAGHATKASRRIRFFDYAGSIDYHSRPFDDRRT